jgi:hypothetical protein
MRKNILLTVIGMMFTIFLFSCGGGSSDGSAPDTMTVTISGPTGTTTTTYSEGTYNSQGTLDPNLISYVTHSNETRIELHNSMTIYPQFVSIGIIINSNTPQSYPLCNPPTNSVSYSAYHQSYISIDSNPCGTVTISSIGNVGDKITGTFDVSLISLTSSTNTSDTVKISGSFNVTRDQ